MKLELSTLPPAAWIAIIALGIVQLGLMVLALIQLARTPRERVNLDRKWLWVIIILAANLIGSILFLAVGRKPAPAAAAPMPGAGGPDVARLVDLLYGATEYRTPQHGTPRQPEGGGAR